MREVVEWAGERREATSGTALFFYLPRGVLGPSRLFAAKHAQAVALRVCSTGQRVERQRSTGTSHRLATTASPL